MQPFANDIGDASRRFAEMKLSASFALSGVEHRYIRQTIKMELAVTNGTVSVCY
jgi:hypothetical protein